MNKTKLLLISVLIVFISLAISSCEKENVHAKKLYRNEGRWTIDYATTQFFDSTGTKTYDSTIYTLGELVLFKSTSLNALYGYRQAVYLFTDTAGTHGFSFEYVFDGKRITLNYCKAPFIINGTYSVAIDKVREQQWEIYVSNGNTTTTTSMTTKYILHLSRSKN